MKKEVNVISLGAGVQSSTMAMLYDRGTLKDKIDFAVFAVFADTQAEPKDVYTYLKFLKRKIKSFPIFIATKGDIVADTLSGGRFASAPFFILKDDGTKGMGRRQCTNEYKIQVVQKCIREKLGYKKGQWMRHHINMHIGISTDEVQRMRDSRTKWITNKYPLIDDINYSRTDCLEYFDSIKMKRPPRSACWMCPFRNDDEWINLKENHPVEFKQAVDFDNKIRTLPKFKHKNYLHRSCTPLGEVEFKPKRTKEQLGFLSDMNNECEGMCGL